MSEGRRIDLTQFLMDIISRLVKWGVPIGVLLSYDMEYHHDIIAVHKKSCIQRSVTMTPSPYLPSKRQ